MYPFQQQEGNELNSVRWSLHVNFFILQLLFLLTREVLCISSLSLASWMLFLANPIQPFHWTTQQQRHRGLPLSLSLLCCGFFFNIILFFLAKESWFWLELLGSNYLYNKFMQIYFKKFLYIVKPSLSSLQLVSQLNYAPKLNFKANLKK